MKKLLMIFVAMLITNSLCAEEYFYINDFEVSLDQIGGQIEVPVKAHFDYYVSAWMVDFILPDGLTILRHRRCPEMTLTGFDAFGDTNTFTPSLIASDNKTRVIVASSEEGYDEDGNFYGVLKWGPGEYDQMWIVVFSATADFAGGEITIATEPACGADSRPEVVPCPRGQHNERTCEVSVTGNVEPVGDNLFQMDDMEIFHGETATFPVRLTNTDAIVAFQTDIYLPEGFTVATNGDNEPIITPSSRLTNDYVIMADIISDGVVRVICYSPQSNAIIGNEGDLFYIALVAPENVSNNYTINLCNSRLTTSDYSELCIPDASAVITVKNFIPGDVNDSHTVTVTDIVVAGQYILQRNPNPFIFDAADMNGDGIITVTDIMLIARLIMTPSTNATHHAPILIAGGDYMSGENIVIAAGETRRVSIALNNEMDYIAFQLDLLLPDGLTASNFQMTDRAGRHTFDMEAIDNCKVRVLCYSPTIEAINGHESALLTFDVTAMGEVTSDISVDGIEMVTTSCKTVLLDAFAIGVKSSASVNELSNGKSFASIEYFNLAGQKMERPAEGVTLVVTTYTDGTQTTTKILR